MSRTAGSYYVQNTDFESYAYYFALGFEPNKKHNFQFTITSSPQWHDQRSFTSKIQDYIDYNPDHDGNPYRQYNPDFGYYTDAAGRRRALSNKSNFYAKPVMMFNWDWNITPKSKLSTVLYASNGRGGGTGDLGDLGGVRGQNVTAYRDADGHINYDAIFAANAAIDANTAGAKHTLVRRASMNSHNWYGILANFQHKINDNWKFSIGTDDRYYYGYHYQTLTHLYGANGYKYNSNKNIHAKVVSRVHDYKNLPWNPFGGKTLGQEEHIGYSNDGEVLWYSGFGQVEFTKNNFSAFIQGSVSNHAYRRIDNFVKEDGTTKQQGQFVDTKTSFKNLIGYNVKGGANYNINENHNVFANVGFYSKQPFMSAVYPNNQQVLNPNLTNEKIFSAEVGYGFRSSKFNANLNLYRTEWRDRSARIPNQTFVTASGNVRGYSEINGITQVHMGVEVDATYKPVKFLELQGMFSYGDYRYKGNATGADFDESNNPVTTTTGNTTLYLDQVKVGGSGNSSIPQLTASLGATIKPISDLSIYGTWRFVGNLYSAVNTNDYKTVARQEQGALRSPDYNLLDLGASYKLRLRERSQYFTFGVNVYNVIDTYYISDASTSIHATGASTTYKGIDTKNRVFFGAGRTWAASVAFNF